MTPQRRVLFVPFVSIGCIAVAVIAWTLSPVGTALVYDRAAVASGEWWRLATGSFAHFSRGHLLANSIGLAISGWMLEREDRWSAVLLFAVSTFVCGIAVHIFEPARARYGGLSGVVTGTIILVALRGLRGGGARAGLCAAALVVLAAKLAFDAMVPRVLVVTPGTTVIVSAASHLAAAACALVLFAWSRRPRPLASLAVRWRCRRFAPLALSRTLATLPLVGLLGCAMHGVGRRGASIAEHLVNAAPHSAERPPLVQLTFPLRVAVTFVPDQPPSRVGETFRPITASSLTNAEKTVLTRRVAEALRANPLIAEAEPLAPIPALVTRDAAALLDSLARSSGSDILILLGYDQTQHATDRWSVALMGASLTGIGVVAATDTSSPNYVPAAVVSLSLIVLTYVLPTQRVETMTLVDAVAYHVPSGRVLFRAPGAGRLRGHTWAIGIGNMHREQAEQGIAQATEELKANLSKQLVAFEKNARSSPERFRVVDHPEK